MLTKHLKTIESAHAARSHYPDKRAALIVSEYSAELDDDVKTLQNAGKDQEKIDRYTVKYEQYFMSWINAGSRVVNWFVVGPAGLNNRRNEKRMRWEDNAYEKFRRFRSVALKRILKAPKLSLNEELEKRQIKLEKEENNLSMMNHINATIRKNKGITPQELHEQTGLSLDICPQILTPNCYGTIGFESYALTNCRARIKQAKYMLLKAQCRQTATDKEYTAEINGEAVTIKENNEADRYQLFFNSKPLPETIRLLKSKAFKWSPKNQCWQRQITNNTQYALRYLTNGTINKVKALS